MEPKGYSGFQIGVHWLVAILMGSQFLFSDEISRAWRAFSRAVEGSAEAAAPVASTMAWEHIIVGVMVLALAVWRVIARMTRGAPGAAAGETAMQVLAAKVVHLGLYLVMFGLPITGLLAWYGRIGFMGELHQIAKMGFIALVGLHVLGAIYNQWVLKNGLIGRMMKPES